MYPSLHKDAWLLLVYTMSFMGYTLLSTLWRYPAFPWIGNDYWSWTYICIFPKWIFQSYNYTKWIYLWEQYTKLSLCKKNYIIIIYKVDYIITIWIQFIWRWLFTDTFPLEEQRPAVPPHQFLLQETLIISLLHSRHL